MTGVHVGYMDTDMVARIDAPETVAAVVVAEKIVAAIRDGRSRASDRRDQPHGETVAEFGRAAYL